MKAIPWPIWEMHLSHNGIGTETAMRLLQALHLSEHYPFVGSRKGQLNPLWLRLEYNRIDANLFLQGCDAAELTYCIPPDRQTCQTKRCGVNKGLAPALHLPFFRSQVQWRKRGGGGGQGAMPTGEVMVFVSYVSSLSPFPRPNPPTNTVSVHSCPRRASIAPRPDCGAVAAAQESECSQGQPGRRQAHRRPRGRRPRRRR